MAKETYTYGKRDLHIWQKRHTHTAKENSYLDQRISSVNALSEVCVCVFVYVYVYVYVYLYVYVYVYVYVCVYSIECVYLLLCSLFTIVFSLLLQLCEASGADIEHVAGAI